MFYRYRRKICWLKAKQSGACDGPTTRSRPEFNDETVGFNDVEIFLNLKKFKGRSRSQVPFASHFYVDIIFVSMHPRFARAAA